MTSTPGHTAVPRDRIVGTVRYPDGRPAPATVVDLTALSDTGVPWGTAFNRAVSDADGQFNILVPATHTLRSRALRTGGRLHLRADLSKVAAPVPGRPAGYGATVTGAAVLDQEPSTRFAALPAGDRAVAHVVETVLLALAIENPTEVADVVTATANTPNFAVGQDPFAVVANAVTTATVGSPPNAETFRNEHLPTLPLDLRTQIDAYSAEMGTIPLHEYLVTIPVNIADWNAMAYAVAPQLPSPLDNITGYLTTVAEKVPAYQSEVERASMRLRDAVDQAALDGVALAASSSADPLVRAVDNLLVTASHRLTGLSTLTASVAATADAVLAEAVGLATDTTFRIEQALADALGETTLDTTALATLAGRVNYDPDYLAGNEAVDDPETVPPLGSKGYTQPIKAVENVGTYSGVAAGDVLDGQEDSDDDCHISYQRPPIKDDPNYPIPGAHRYVVLTLLRCANEEDPERDFYGWHWWGNVNTYDDDVYFHLLNREKFRTQLNTNYQRTTHAPVHDISGGDSWEVHWSASWNGMGFSGDYTVIKATKTHPWADNDGYLAHVSWMRNKDGGKSGGPFQNGFGMGFQVPQGENKDRVRIRANNLIEIRMCDVGKRSGYKECIVHS